ncbi:hypothetical protein PQX77_005997 [Marasmius sp. AFHP31]|nr:hypothetical protein PQX77_005997 [Marasmius sp. AFHP31]
MQSSFFSNARGFHISGGNFSHVQGDQYNHTTLPIPSSSSSDPSFALIDESATSTITAVYNVNGNQINQVIQHEKKEPTEFDDYRIVKRGDICILRDVCDDDSPWVSYRRVTRTTCIAKVNGAQGNFTVMSYNGPGGRKAFEKDFRRFSSVVTAKVPQMYAVDIGSIPSILYWNELVPAVVLKGNVGLLGQMYLYSLRRHWNCTERELWMDPTRGVICRGPEGPYPNLRGIGFRTDDMPSTVDLLQEDACLRFIASCKSKVADRAFVEGIKSAGSHVVVPESFDQPTVISALTQTPIAVGNNVWESISVNFVERKVLESGLTSWRWIVSSVVELGRIGLDDDLSVYRPVWHRAVLSGHLSYDQIHCQRQSQQPIYLFLHPPPPNQPRGKTSSLHFWSSHEDGQKPLPLDICDELGLPTTLGYSGFHYPSFFWRTKSYKQLDEYQRLRGFNPTTTDFAQHLGYDGNIFQPINDTDRFDEDYEEPSLEPLEPHPNTDYLDLSTTEYPATQQGNISKKLDSKDEPTSPNLATKRRRMGGGEGKIERRIHPEQNLHHKSHGACNEPSVSDLSLRTIRPLPRRSLPSEELYSPEFDSARLADCASNVDSLSLRHYDYEEIHHPLPGFPASLPPTSTSFGVLPANAFSTSNAAFQTEVTPGGYQCGFTTMPSRSQLSRPGAEWSTYSSGGATSFHTFPSSGSTIPSSNFTQPDIRTASLSMRAPQTTGFPGGSTLDTSTYSYRHTSPFIPPNDFSVPPHTPPVGYTTNLGIHAHGLYPTVPQRYTTFVPYHSSGTSLPDKHWNAPPQLELQPVSSGPYADPSVYEQPTLSNESHSLWPPTAPDNISISPDPLAVGHPIDHSETLQTIDHPSHPVLFDTIDSAPIHDTMPTAGFTETSSTSDGHGAPHPSEEPKYPPSEGCTSPPAAQHQQQPTVLSHPHPHPMGDTSSYELVDLEAGASGGGSETRRSRWRSRMAAMVRFLRRSGYFRFMLIWVFLALLLIEYGTSRGN